MPAYDALPPRVRTLFYVAFDGLGTALGAAEVGLLASGRHWEPLTIALAVYGFLSARVHGLARANVPQGRG